jgi:hypothetical protein
MSHPAGPDHGAEAAAEPAVDATDDATVVMPPASPPDPPAEEPERRFTAPSAFDAGSTQQIERPPEPATEIISAPTEPLFRRRRATPRTIRAWRATKVPAGRRRSWGWVVAVLLVIAALVAVAVLGTVLLTRHDTAQASHVGSSVAYRDMAIEPGRDS